MPNVSDAPDMSHRRLLLISYWYPPAVGAAAERAYGFTRHLPPLGWDVSVLTAGQTELDNRPRASGEPAVNRVVDPLAPPVSLFADYDPRSKPSRFRAFLRELVFPDRFFRWQRAAYNAGLDAIRRQPPSLILASFPPASAVLLGLRLHEATGIPLVLDFRDRWLGPGGYEPILNRTRRKHARLEQTATSRAAGIITGSEALSEAVAAEHGYDRGRIFVISNGYDPDFGDHDQASLPQPSPQPPPQPPPEAPFRSPPLPLRERVGVRVIAAGSAASLTGARLTFSHIGTVIQRNRPDLFFQSIGELAAGGRLQGVAFRFVGNLSRGYLTATGLTPFVEANGLVSRETAWGEIHNAEALLLLTGDYVGKWGYNAKIFEYVRSGRPILCLEETPNSNDRGLLERFAAERSFFAPVNDPPAIAQAISQVREWLSRPPQPAPPLDDAFRLYDRRTLAAKLAACLDQIVRRSLPGATA